MIVPSVLEQQLEVNMNILFLSRWFPFPPDNGSRIRVHSMLRTLASEHVVDLISFAGIDASAIDFGPAREICRKVTVVPYHGFQPGSKKAVQGLLSTVPSSVVATYSRSMQESVDEAWRPGLHDVIIASQLDMAPYARRLAAGPKLLEEVELTSFWEQPRQTRNLFKKLRSHLMWWKMSHYIADMVHDFDAITVASEEERTRLLEIAPVPEKIHVVPNGVDIQRFDRDYGDPVPGTLVYSGSLTYSANLEAVSYFVERILPEIRRVRPDATLLVTGSFEGVPVEKFRQAGGVEFTGYLDDVRPTVGTAWLSVVPLISGGGTRLKVLEALALGTPVVSSTKGVEGLQLVPGRDFICANTPAEFAMAIIDLLGNPQERARLSKAGRETVRERHGWAKSGKEVLELLDDLLPQSRGEYVKGLLKSPQY